MRKGLVVSLITVVSLLSSTAFAAAWNVPTNVRKVQKSNTDTAGRIYGTIQAAINSITNASAANPYVVQVMPGVYTEMVTMKPYVDLVGSGQENTVITNATAPTVIGASNTTIRNLKITNTDTVHESRGILFSSATATAQDVAITLSGSGLYNQRAVFVDNGSIVCLSNVHIQVQTPTSQCGRYVNAGIRVDGGSRVNVMNSAVIVLGCNNGLNQGEAYALDDTSGAGSVIINSYMEASNAWDNYTVLGDNISTSGSKIIATNLYPSYKTDAFYGFGQTINSEIRATNQIDPAQAFSFSSGWSGGTYMVASSLVQGNIDPDNPAKVVNCWDQNFNPLPNQ